MGGDSRPKAVVGQLDRLVAGAEHNKWKADPPSVGTMAGHSHVAGLGRAAPQGRLGQRTVVKAGKRPGLGHPREGQDHASAADCAAGHSAKTGGRLQTCWLAPRRMQASIHTACHHVRV